MFFDSSLKVGSVSDILFSILKTFQNIYEEHLKVVLLGKKDPQFCESILSNPCCPTANLTTSKEHRFPKNIITWISTEIKLGRLKFRVTIFCAWQMKYLY